MINYFNIIYIIKLSKLLKKYIDKHMNTIV